MLVGAGTVYFYHILLIKAVTELNLFKRVEKLILPLDEDVLRSYCIRAFGVGNTFAAIFGKYHLLLFTILDVVSICLLFSKATEIISIFLSHLFSCFL